MTDPRIKSRSDLEGIFASCRIVAALLDEIEERIDTGVTTAELDAWAEQFIIKHGATPSFKGYRGFPATLCLSVNDEIVHGIPGSKVLREGDILKVDVGANLGGYFSDSARTYPVGLISEEAERLLDVTKQALEDGIRATEANSYLTDIGRAISHRIQSSGYKVIRDLTGHGVGFAQHEPPTVYNFPVPEEDMRLRNGMVLAIEPMAAIGTERIYCASDGWTFRTLDGSLAAHFEHTVAVWDGRPVVLTRTGDEVALEYFGARARS
ncbi:MAG: type I methionyl aminopeptidase [bacterium]|jgi:methionyl aminopeptidase